MANIIKHRSRSDIYYTDPLSTLITFDDSDDFRGWNAYSAKFGVVPHAFGGPVILAPTAFNRTINNQKPIDIPIVFNHNMDMVIAINNGNEVDNIGLRYNAQLIENDEESFRIYNMIKQGALRQNSVGFFVEKSHVDKDTGFEKITEARLDHHSVVTKAANPKARVSKVFSEDMNALQENDPLNSTHDLDSQLAIDSQTSAHSDSLILIAGANRIMRLTHAKIKKQNSRGS